MDFEHSFATPETAICVEYGMFFTETCLHPKCVPFEDAGVCVCVCVCVVCVCVHQVWPPGRLVNDSQVRTSGVYK